MITVPIAAVTVADMVGVVHVDAGATHMTLYYAGDPLPDLVIMPSLSKLVTVAEFRARFTDAETTDILALAYAGAGDVNAAMLLLKLQTSNEIDVASAEVQAGLAYLTARGVLAPGRAAEIVAG